MGFDRIASNYRNTATADIVEITTPHTLVISIPRCDAKADEQIVCISLVNWSFSIFQTPEVSSLARQDLRTYLPLLESMTAAFDRWNATYAFFHEKVFVY